MADYSRGELYIPQNLYDSDLVVRNLINEYDWSERETDEKVITFVDNEASYGKFDYLESQLKKLGISFNRKSANCSDVPDQLRMYRPAEEGKEEIDKEISLSYDNYEPYIEISYIKNILREDINEIDKLKKIQELVNFYGEVEKSLYEY
ncbi:hypothetical protein [Alkaliphilus sp. B6464]|uniref:hypothetical protein n=1 Tax=Alkaliphilus sp. B6464 TaxID=2731219 RepID=UPI001BA98525|nr:hypothetical protein [Alkaliphilus sp. B6464]QUH21866.1 hypothetical protein HYG84_18185 [Alkaliphilus sp. B6464]